MREEAFVFRDLSTLCTSQGYVHALAYLCFRDNVISYADEMRVEDMQHLFSPDRLIRTEISTLIGLMVQREIDWTLPDPHTVQRYIDKTEELLRELHQSMFAPTVEELRSLIETGEKIDPFDKGANLREAIFYGGESAYSFQFRDLSVPKYEADEPWLEKHKGFSIQGARDVVQALIEFENDRFSDAIPELSHRDPKEWTFLPYFSFTVEELAKTSGLDQILIENVLRAFTLSTEERNATFSAIDDFNIVSAMPIIPVGDGHLILLEGYTLEQSLYESPFFWMVGDLDYRESAFRNRGKFLEDFSLARLQAVFGRKSVFSNVRIPNVKGKDEIDTLVLFGDRAIVVQAKSKRLTLEARKGNDNLIRDDFKKSVQDSYDQALACAKALVTPDQILLSSEGSKIDVPKTIKEVYLFCVVSDHYPALSFQARQFLKYEVNSTIQPAFVLDIFTLDTMAEMLDSPLYFLSYVNRRTNYHELILAGHELTILSYHLKKNLWFEKEYSLVHLDDPVIAGLDVAMTVRREGRPGERTPDGILTKLKGTRVGEIIKDIESRPDPGTISLGFALLKLSEKTAVQLSNAIDRMATQSNLDNDQHDLTMPMGQSGDGLTVHCSERPLALAGPKLESHCLVRKYKANADRWYGICIAPDKSVRFGVSLDFPWKYDEVMEKVISTLPRSGLCIDMKAADGRRIKIDRNDPCPCGSGRKYKKCCLL